MKNTLLLIAAALTLMIGSFIWFVATWDATTQEPLTSLAPDRPFILANKLPPEGPPAAGALFFEKGTT